MLPSEGTRIDGLPIRFLVDTHIVVRWFVASKKLSRDQTRVLEDAERRGEPAGVSAITALEIALLGESGLRITGLDRLFQVLETSLFRLIPLTVDVAREVAALGDALRDPFDRAIVATARVHRLRLLTSDERIIESRLVPVIE